MRLPESISKRLDFPRTVWREYGKDNGSLVAAAVSFYDFLSLFPLLLFAVAVLAIVVGSSARAESILTSSLGFAADPGTQSMIREVIHGKSAATGIGLVLLLWSGTTAVVTLERGINLAWEITDRRSFLKQRGLALVILVVVGLLALASVAMTAVIKAARTGPNAFLANMSWAWDFLGYPIPLLLSIALFTIVYKLLPYTQVPWKVALTGGVFSGVLWEVAKLAFAFYVLNFANYNKVYGSLGGVILLLVWINYSAVITILGAELASEWQKRHTPAQDRQRGRR